jgi:hypothetical protein
MNCHCNETVCCYAVEGEGGRRWKAKTLFDKDEATLQHCASFSQRLVYIYPIIFLEGKGARFGFISPLFLEFLFILSLLASL